MLSSKKPAEMKKEFNGSAYFPWLNLQSKVWLAALIFFIGILLQGFYILGIHHELKYELQHDNRVREEALAKLRTISCLSPSLLSRCQVGLTDEGKVETSDVRESLAREIADLKVILGDQQRLKVMISHYQTLNDRLENSGNMGLTLQQYLEIKKVYQGYNASLNRLQESLYQYREGNLRMIMSSHWAQLVIAIILLGGILTLIGILLRSAAQSLAIPAEIMSDIFRSAKQKVFKVEIPIFSHEGLGNAAFIIKDSLEKWNSKFMDSRNSIYRFDSLCKELVTEIRKTELFAIQLQTVAEELTENFEDQNHLIAGARKQLAALIDDSDQLHKVPQRLIVTHDDLKNQMAIVQDQINSVLSQTFEYQDESTEIGNLAANLNMASEKVNGVISILNDVAERTEMLAFNAAIQAARAGEKGLGFGVVAKEIAKLVDYSQKASLQLSALLNKIKIKNEYILELIRDNEKSTVIQTSVYGEVLEICNDLFASIQTGFDDIEKLSRVMEMVFTKSSQLSSQANMIARFAEEENIGPVNFDLETLDYQLNVKEANRIAQKVSEISMELRTLAETASGEGEFLY